MNFYLIIGPQAVGKMTVGQELAKLTGAKLFHNHLTIDLVGQFFDYSTAEGERLVALYRKLMFDEVINAQDYPGFIFTFICNFDDENSVKRVYNLCESFEKAHHTSYLVELSCDYEARKKRNLTENRMLHKPSKRDVARSSVLFEYGESAGRAHSFPGEVTWKHYLKIDNTTLDPEEAAKLIVETFGTQTAVCAKEPLARQTEGNPAGWTDAYADALDEHEREALVEIAQIAIMDNEAAKLNRTGFGQILEYGPEGFCSYPDVGELPHDAQACAAYQTIFDEVIATGVDIAQEPAFVALHGRIFKGSSWAGRYNTVQTELSPPCGCDNVEETQPNAQRAKDRPSSSDALQMSNSQVIYRGAPPEIMQQELIGAFEAYHKACEARPDLALAYAGILHNHIMAIHPFRDGNGRMARLVLVSELARMGLLKAQDLPLALVERTNRGWSYPCGPGNASGDSPNCYETFGDLCACAFDTMEVLKSAYNLLCLDDEKRKAAICPANTAS